MIINETTAKRFFPNRNPIGQTIRRSWPADVQPDEVIGVMKDSKYLRLNEGNRAIIFGLDAKVPKDALSVRIAASLTYHLKPQEPSPPAARRR